MKLDSEGALNLMLATMVAVAVMLHFHSWADGMGTWALLMLLTPWRWTRA